MIKKPDLIDLSRMAPFLPHQGGRLGEIHDPPGPSFCVEGGAFKDIAFDGLVFTPASPASAATRIDVVVADPISQNLVLVAGTPGAGVPSTSAYPGAGKICEVTLIGNSNGKVLIKQADLRDVRTLLQEAQDNSTNKMVASAIIKMGINLNAVGELIAGGKLQVVATRTWVRIGALKHHYSRTNGTQITYVDLKYVGTLAEYHITVAPYNTLICCVTDGQNGWASTQGVSWVALPPDPDGYPKFRVYMGVINAHGDEKDQERVTVYDVPNGRFIAYEQAQVVIQVWGRT